MTDNKNNSIRRNLTASQHRIWLGQQLAPDAPLYNMVLAFRISGSLDVGRFQLACRDVMNSADALRLVFSEDAGVPQQRLLETPSLSTSVIDLSDQEDPERELANWIESQRGFRFPLDRPMLASTLLKLADDEFVWYLNQHHLITDAWSTMLLYSRLSERYRALSENAVDVPDPVPAYLDFVKYEADQRNSPKLEQARQFWEERTRESPPPLQFYGRRQSGRSTRTERLTFDLDETRSSAAAALFSNSKTRSLTRDLTGLNAFLAVFAAWQHRVTGQDRVSIGTMVHNRSTAAMRDTVGLFVELFPVAIDVEASDTFLDVLRRIQLTTMQVLPHAIPGASQFTGKRPFQTVLNYNTVGFGNFAGLPTTPEWIHAGHGDPDHLLRLQVHDFGTSGRLSLHFDFNIEVFSEKQRTRAVTHFVRLLDAFLHEPETVIASVGLADDEEQSAVRSFAEPAEPLHVRKTVVDLFRQQAERSPKAIAVQEGNSLVTFEQLDRFLEQLSVRIGNRVADDNGTVGICMPRSPELVASVLAVLKAGCAYVPIDAATPPERLRHMLKDANCKLVLTNGSVFAAPDDSEVSTLDVSLRDTDSAQEVTTSARRPPSPDDVAYIMYTSGSTGVPKGVVVDHRALVHYAEWARQQYVPAEPLDFALCSSFTFDLTVTSMFVPLISGGRIVVYRETTDAGSDLSVLNVFQDSDVDIVKLTPSHLALLRDLDLSQSRISQLIVGGEDFRTELARGMDSAFGGDVVIWNEYGPTEATVACALHRYDPESDLSESVPIGKPADHATIFVIDGADRDCPIGIAGEICIAGAGLARGYLNLPDLTSERFAAQSQSGRQRFYRSGDMGRWREDGVLEYLGRVDRQVKVNGVRMELTEIEAIIGSHPEVHDCVVDVVQVDHPRADHGLPRLCAQCGIADNHPDVHIDDAGVCNMCLKYQQWRAAADDYFRSPDDLRRILAEEATGDDTNAPDCLVMLSGGKDSTYALYRIVEMGARPLVFTLDNGYISKQALENNRRVADDLGLELHVATTPAMNDIFVDSLKRFGNVCNGCFKTIYTLATNVAVERGIRLIITGLSRGQIFETRLSEFYRSGIFDPDEVDRGLIEARKAYHRATDAVSRLLDVDRFRQDDVFHDVRFVDFYRYCDVELSDMYQLLNERGAWRRPDDTGRSTNCLINVAGIHVHTTERGYHNYASPYAWDVRLNHKTRDEAVAELNDDIDETEVNRILSEIGYDRNWRSQTSAGKRLAVWYTGRKDLDREMPAYLRRFLPETMIPRYVRWMEQLPLTANGKIDRAALLASPIGIATRTVEFEAPRTPTEKALAEIWRDLLGPEQVGRLDNFFDLGGDSIMSLQVVIRAARRSIRITAVQLFEHPTIEALAAVAETEAPDTIAKAQPSRLNSLSEASLSRLGSLLGGDDAEAG